MTDFTPEQQRQILDYIESCSKDWEFVVRTKEIRRSKKMGLAGWIDRVWRRKHKVEALYRWIQFQLGTERYAVLSQLIERDQIPKRGRYPRVYRLLNGWTIPAKDLRTLTHGPLVDLAGEELVKPGGQLSYFWNHFWPRFVVVATVVGFVASVVSLLGLTLLEPGIKIVD